MLRNIHSISSLLDIGSRHFVEGKINVKFLEKGSFTDKLTALDSFHKTADDGNSGSHFCSKAFI